MASNGARINMAQMSDQKKSETIKWDDLLRRAVREHYGAHAKVAPYSPQTEVDKKEFLKQLLSDAKNINPREPEEISRNTVDVNEKVYTNTKGGEDESTIKIVSCVENSEGHNYQETTTKGIEWGVNANVGLQFGLPQVGVGGSGRVGFQYKRTNLMTISQEHTKKERVETQAHHEETIKIPPGKKVQLKMTSYRVRYKLDYTMEYRIDKSAHIRVKVDTCGIGLPYVCLSSGFVTASQMMQPLPGYREDEEFVYFTQEGELRWIADRVVVNKTVADA